MSLLQLHASAVCGSAVGVGVDLVDIADFDALPFESNVAFYERMFSAQEIACCRARASAAQHFAARFAAKEAAVKAFSSVAQLGYWQIEVVNDGETGVPKLRVWNADRTQLAEELADYRALVSLTHTSTCAGAFVAVYQGRA